MSKMAVQTQSYGPEARGGASKSEVVIAAGEIDHPEVLSADVVVTLSQEAYDKYAASVKPGGLLIVDDEKVQPYPDAPRPSRSPSAGWPSKRPGKPSRPIRWRWACWSG